MGRVPFSSPLAGPLWGEGTARNGVGRGEEGLTLCVWGRAGPGDLSTLGTLELGDAPLRPKGRCGCSQPCLLLLPDTCMASGGREWNQQPSQWRYSVAGDTAWSEGENIWKGGILPKVYDQNNSGNHPATFPPTRTRETPSNKAPRGLGGLRCPSRLAMAQRPPVAGALHPTSPQRCLPSVI